MTSLLIIDVKRFRGFALQRATWLYSSVAFFLGKLGLGLDVFHKKVKRVA